MDGDVLSKFKVAQIRPRTSPGDLAESYTPSASPAASALGIDQMEQSIYAEPLPRLGEDYRAHAKPLSRHRLGVDPKMLHFVDRLGWSEGYAFSDLRRVSWKPGGKPGDGPVLVLRFVEAVVTDIVVEGRNLEAVHTLVSEASIPWLWEQPEGIFMTKDSDVVITRISSFLIDRDSGKRKT
ncbi:hypothetical protein [Paludisphaera borealis]|uniref:Uncharacterized protein n=1 Tax=Paludisphaera borealis TaxID=1387353 RepID=A0A1U7CZK4_9BACT|nr:hypothetical protein [Paludisphaera borealis]APW64318.1 hypothetical protein BSF38_20038 [Paludisphaera borealis]